jgi:hypothetical protein
MFCASHHYPAFSGWSINTLYGTKDLVTNFALTQIARISRAVFICELVESVLCTGKVTVMLAPIASATSCSGLTRYLGLISYRIWSVQRRVSQAQLVGEKSYHQSRLSAIISVLIESGMPSRPKKKRKQQFITSYSKRHCIVHSP